MRRFNIEKNNVITITISEKEILKSVFGKRYSLFIKVMKGRVIGENEEALFLKYKNKFYKLIFKKEEVELGMIPKAEILVELEEVNKDKALVEIL